MPTAKPSRFRLSPDVRPILYDLHLVPDLAAGTFTGEVQTTIALAKPRSEIVLHATELQIESASVRVGGEELKARTRLIPADETGQLTPPRRPPAGEATLVLRWRAKLNQHLRGFYAASANGKPYAFTQCEAADARRVMPCFDEPSFKARFRIAVTAHDGDAVVSN